MKLTTHNLPMTAENVNIHTTLKFLKLYKYDIKYGIVFEFNEKNEHIFLVFQCKNIPSKRKRKCWMVFTVIILVYVPSHYNTLEWIHFFDYLKYHFFQSFHTLPPRITPFVFLSFVPQYPLVPQFRVFQLSVEYFK